VEPVSVASSPEAPADPAPDPDRAPKPDPSPPAAVLKPPKLETGSPPAPVVAEPAAPSAQPAPVSASTKPKPKHVATPKKPKQKPASLSGSGKKNGLPKSPPPASPIQQDPVGTGTAAVSPPIVAGVVASPSDDGGSIRATLSIALFGLLGAAIALFGLAAVPAGALGGAVVSLLVATRRVELAAGGALTLAASATILAVISLSS
jgi:outer membrane biosynthesis protein TonB